MILYAVYRHIPDISTIIRRPITSPACSSAQGIDKRDVPIIVFQMAKMVTILLCLPAEACKPRNWIWKKEAGIACSGMFNTSKFTPV